MARILAAALVLLLALAAPALAQGKGNSNNKGKAGKADPEITGNEIVRGAAAGVLGGVLGREEREIIHRYFNEHRNTYGKVKPLPPGIRRKVARGGTLPPGIAKQVLPDGLHRQLPQRDGYDYNVVGTDVVLIERATNVIVDILRDVLLGR